MSSKVLGNIGESKPPSAGKAAADLQAQLEERADDLRELADLLAMTKEDNEAMARVLEADERVAAALAEAKRFRELARVTQERNNGLMGQNHALGQAAKRWMNKFLRLEKATKGLGDSGLFSEKQSKVLLSQTQHWRVSS